MTVSFGGRSYTLGGRYLGAMREANRSDDPEALRARLAEDGYLLLRGLHDAGRVAAARRAILDHMASNGQLDPSYPLDSGAMAPGAGSCFFGDVAAVARHPAFLALAEAPELMDFFGRLFGAPVLTYDYKWPRAVAPGGFTGAHYDIVYMGRGTSEVLSLWTPLGDIPYAMGPLAVLHGAHRWDRLLKTYGTLDVDRDNVELGWLSKDPAELVERYSGQWLTAEFAMGDALIFGMFTMHASLDNSTSCYRLSADTRYQRRDQPVDERWVGRTPPGHYAWGKTPPIPMEAMRKRWDV